MSQCPNLESRCEFHVCGYCICPWRGVEFKLGYPTQTLPSQFVEVRAFSFWACLPGRSLDSVARWKGSPTLLLYCWSSWIGHRKYWCFPWCLLKSLFSAYKSNHWAQENAQQHFGDLKWEFSKVVCLCFDLFYTESWTSIFKCVSGSLSLVSVWQQSLVYTFYFTICTMSSFGTHPVHPCNTQCIYMCVEWMAKCRIKGQLSRFLVELSWGHTSQGSVVTPHKGLALIFPSFRCFSFPQTLK